VWAALIAVVLSASSALAQQSAPVPDASATASVRSKRLRLLASDYGVGAAATVVAVPVSMALAAWAGSLSSDLLWAALPAAAIFIALPAVLVTLIEVIISNREVPGSGRWRPALWLGLGAQTVLLAIGVLAHVWVGDVVAAALFTLLEAVVLPAAVTGGFWLKWRVEPPPRLALDSAVVPAARLSFAF
jgi:hypothetical protein